MIDGLREVPLTRFAVGAAALAVALFGPVACGESKAWKPGEVSFDRLVAARSDSANWLTYSGAYDGQRYSLLSEVNRGSVHRLRRAWEHDLETGNPVETSPLVVDGVLFLTRPPSDVIALDAATGSVLWKYHWPVAEGQLLCCGKINRGLAILGSTLFLTTLDAHLVALDARSGAKKWDVVVADWRDGFSITAAPLVVKDLVLTGTALDQISVDYQRNGEIPQQRGRIDAYDASTGALRWRFYTVPVRGEPGSETWTGESWTAGGNATWMTGSYDPESDLVYWGVAAPTSTILGNPHPGDNLFGSSVVALNAQTGARVWHYQFTPHDTHDGDAAQVPVLAEMNVSGRLRRTLLSANRNGFYYVLDRDARSFVRARAFAQQNWAEGIDSTGRPVITRDMTPSLQGVEVSPTIDGATSWWSPSFSPSTGLFYVTAHDASEFLQSVPLPAIVDRAARLQVAQRFQRQVRADKLVSAVRALDAQTGVLRWEFRLPLRSTGGILTTAGDVLFTGSTLGDFWALDARTGAVLWHEKVEGWIHAAPITYRVGGHQYVSIASSKALYTFRLGP